MGNGVFHSYHNEILGRLVGQSFFATALCTTAFVTGDVTFPAMLSIGAEVLTRNWGPQRRVVDEEGEGPEPRRMEGGPSCLPGELDWLTWRSTRSLSLMPREGWRARASPSSDGDGEGELGWKEGGREWATSELDR